MISISLCQDSMDPARQTRFELYRSGRHGAWTTAICKYIWSPIAFDGGYRQKKSFRESRLAGFDFDDGRWRIDDAIMFCEAEELKYVIGTTKSHQLAKTTAAGVSKPPCDRFRLIIPFASAITTCDQYEYNIGLMMEKMPVDKSCKDGARFFFPCKEIVAHMSEGRELDVVDVPPHETLVAKAAVMNERNQSYALSGAMPRWARDALNIGARAGESRHRLCYRLGCLLWRYGKSDEEIVTACMNSPLGAIGLKDIRHQVKYGVERGTKESY